MEKDKNQQEMDRKIKKFKRLLPAALLILGFLCILIAQLIPTEKEPEKELAHEGETHGEPFHHHYSPDMENEPFVADKPVATIQGITFLHPVEQTKRVQENTNSFLMGVNENMFLFRAYGEVSYIYNKEENVRQVIGRKIPKATLCSNPNYVAYISEYEFRTPKIIPFEFGLGNAQALYTAPYDHKITTIVCDEQHIYFTIEDTEGKKTTQSVTLQEFQGKIRPSEASITVQNASDFITKNANGVYVYLPGKNTLHHINPFGTFVNDIPVKVHDNVSRFLQMKLNDNGDYLAVYYDHAMHLKGVINNEVIDGFANLAIAAWYDNQHVLFLDTNTLYLYNTNNKQKEVLKTDVSDFVVSNKDIYYHDSMGGLFYMQRKTEE